ncbi:ribonuclease E activity regulator RraA [Sphingobium sp.]|uniref:ribonuclease E activity regulator RraA n=1 Tax=Sphingobium sp. TaxID=1912891 RepID=UPI002BFE4434|nr:ribonuclease E activity regulator RraA [Sphingobium sp.]HUD92939.1 ribonuclease E activity regulator RraA [Sphingobium sp.]
MTTSCEFTTADLWDIHHETVKMIPVEFRSYGGISRFSGQTVTLATADDHDAVRGILEKQGHGRILFIDCEGEVAIAMIGDRLASLACANDWAGVIVHGAVRDCEALARIDIAVLALRTTAMRSFARTAVHRCGETITVGGVAVAEGGWIYADQDAILVSALPLLASSACRDAR